MSINVISCCGNGDSGKAKVGSWASKNADMFIRVNGSSNRGGEMEFDNGKSFICHMLPSGSINEDCLNIICPTVIVDAPQIQKEIEELNNLGINPQIKVSDRAHILLPYHVDLNRIEEASLGKDKFGSTIRGTTAAYVSVHAKRSFQCNELFEKDSYLMNKIERSYEYKCAIRNMHLKKGRIDEDLTITTPNEILEYIKIQRDFLNPLLIDSRKVINEYLNQEKRCWAECQLGSGRDLWFGGWPWITSSCCLSSFVPVACGVSPHQIGEIYGLIKAFSSTVGGGPFLSEIFGEFNDKIVDIGNEYGRTTLRRRRIGAADMVSAKYGVEVQGATEIVLTKLDILGDEFFEQIPVCVAYEDKTSGKIVKDFPTTNQLENLKGVFEYLPGWQTDISNTTNYDDLPSNAKNYVEFIEKHIGRRIRYISVSKDQRLIDRQRIN